MTQNLKLLEKYKNRIEDRIDKEGVNYLVRMLNLRMLGFKHDISGLSNEELIEAIALDNYMYQLALKNKNNKLVREYIKMIEDIVKQYPYSYNSFLISKFNVINAFSDEIKLKIESYNIKVENIKRKLRGNCDLTSEEEFIISNYFIQKIPTENGDINQLIEKYIINKLKIVASIYYVENNELKCNRELKPSDNTLELITKYCLYNGLKVLDLPLDTTFIFCGKIHNTVRPAFGVAMNFIDTIALTNLFNERNDLFYRIKSSYHEVRHIYQYNPRRKTGVGTSMYYEICLKRLFSHPKVTKYYGGTSEYGINYENHEIEHDANRFGFFMLIYWLKQAGATQLVQYFERKRDEKINHQYSNFKKDDKGNQYPTWIFKFAILDELMSKDPTILSEHPEFKLLYENNGNPKNIMLVLDEIEETFINIPTQNINFMLDYLLYYFKKNKVSNASNLTQLLNTYNNKSPQNKLKIEKNLYYIIRQCFWTIDDCSKLYNNSHNKEVIKQRISDAFNTIDQCMHLIKRMTKDHIYHSQYYVLAQQKVEEFKRICK